MWVIGTQINKSDEWTHIIHCNVEPVSKLLQEAKAFILSSHQSQSAVSAATCCFLTVSNNEADCWTEGETMQCRYCYCTVILTAGRCFLTSQHRSWDDTKSISVYCFCSRSTNSLQAANTMSLYLLISLICLVDESEQGGDHKAELASLEQDVV